MASRSSADMVVLRSSTVRKKFTDWVTSAAGNREKREETRRMKSR